jgi:hypothetical protein
MTEHSTKESIRDTTLYALVRHVGLTPQEVAQLRLSDLHLAGKNPNISFTSENDEPKTVKLDLEGHRALVGWLVARPDSVGDFLFPGLGVEAMDWREIQQRVELVEGNQKTTAARKLSDFDEKTSPPEQTKPPAAREPSVGGSKLTTPPRSTPELGAPPPGLDRVRPSTFQPPPPTAPEEDESVRIPLPTSTPEFSPPTRPPQSAPIPGGKKEETPLADTPSLFSRSSEKESPETGTASAQDMKRGRKRRQQVKTKGQPMAQESTDKQSRSLSRLVMPTVVTVVILLCGGCIGGSWFAWQSEAGQEILTALNLAAISSETLPEERAILASLTPIYSPLPTPTLPPTSTPTALPVTNTPLPPTETATPIATDTPPPTDTPVPVDTPTSAPTNTFTPALPVETPTPTDTPTPAMKYAAPVLLEPEDRAEFIEGNIIVLRWQSVGELAPDEQYAVRLIYSFQNETTFQGTNIKETGWTIPTSLYGQVDGPENIYEWFVVVERLNDDGSGTAISPESERRTFTWK